MNRLRNRLIALFLAGTLVPLVVTVFLVRSLIDRSLNYAPVAELDAVSKSLETAGRELYRAAREDLRQHAALRQGAVARYTEESAAKGPAEIAEFAGSGQRDQFLLSGDGGNRLRYLVRDGAAIVVYEESLGPVGLRRIEEQYAQAREVLAAARERDLKRGFQTTFLLIVSVVWLAAFALLALLAHRVSAPIQQLTAGLKRLAAGDLTVRVRENRDDEVGEAIASFNETAEQLSQSRERLLFVARLESWQSLARKMAHEVKNSLTPIRLTVEEMVARQGSSDPAFLKTAAQIVTDEVTGLERRVRAFTELAAEPPVHPSNLDLNSLVQERLAFLRSGHPDVIYETSLGPDRPRAWADEDLVRGLLTNLIENAAEAAGAAGVVKVKTRGDERQVYFEVHDSGPGLSRAVRDTLFEPTISFKKKGMGIGLSIARKSALLNHGDIELVDGELGGAAFRVRLPRAKAGEECPEESLLSTTKKTSAVRSA